MKAQPKPPRFTFRRRVETEALFMSLGEGAITTDSEARISRVNPKALEILGYKQKDLLGKWFPGILIAEDSQGKQLPVSSRPISQIFFSGKPISTRIYYRRRGKGRIPLFLTAAPIIVKGKPIGAIVVFRDISDELALERAKDEFVAIASHQLRTPATAVKQYIGLLLEGYSEPLTDGQRLFLERAYESNERQLHIVQEMLKISQLELEKVILKPKPTDVRTLIEAAADGLRSKFAAKSQRLIIRDCSEPVIAQIDPQQIQIALENILENASNYSWQDKKVEIACRRWNDRVRISVKDQGVGIDPADYPKLFQKFSRIDNLLSLETSGTGLGLYWAAKIVEMHGGSISVKSAPGRGTTFTINLPLGV